jgi:hypothetical protein
MILKMLKEFYCLPRIDFDSYDPKTRNHSNSTFTAKSSFERTLVFNSTVRKEAFKGEKWRKNSDSFIIDNMNKWPVIFVNLHSNDFGSIIPSHSKIEEILSKTVIKETFEEHEDVLFALMVEKACSLKYKNVTRKTFLKILKDHKIDDNKELSAKIEILWNNYGKKMTQTIKKFYKFYSGEPPYEQVTQSLLFLSQILTKFYDKQVIILVDEHDTPAMQLYSKISLDYREDNTEIITSILCYAKTISILFKNASKYNLC